MRLRLRLQDPNGRQDAHTAALPYFNNLHADYERRLALVDIPTEMYPEWMKEFEHPENAAIDEGAVKHLTLAQREELKRWMAESYPTRPEFETLDLG